MLEAAIEAGADDCVSDDGEHLVSCRPDDVFAVRDGLEKRFGASASARLAWRPRNAHAVADDKAEALLKLLDLLEDSDDVQRVFANFEISEAALRKIGA
jgi:transcriptional/translational regulatory protein YebC/TACO1